MKIGTPASEFARAIAELSGRARREAVAVAAIKTGGLYPYPRRSTCLAEIHLYGINAIGAGEDNAIENWVAKAICIPPKRQAVA